MNRLYQEEYIIGSVSLISNKITQFGDSFSPDITFRQWFLLLMISKMKQEEKTINRIAEFIGMTRQNVKKLLTPLENKGYVKVEKSGTDARAQTFAEVLYEPHCEKARLYGKAGRSSL